MIHKSDCRGLRCNNVSESERERESKNKESSKCDRVIMTISRGACEVHTEMPPVKADKANRPSF